MSREVSQIGVRLPADLRRKLEQLASTAGVTLSEIMRRAVRDYADDGAARWAEIQALKRSHERLHHGDLSFESAPEIRLYGEWMQRLPQEPRELVRQIGSVLGEWQDGHIESELLPEFLRDVPAGVAEIAFDEPLPLSTAEPQQLDRIVRQTFFQHCNDAFAALVGDGQASALKGRRLSSTFTIADPGNLEALQSFVRNGYRLVGTEISLLDPGGMPHLLAVSALGTIADGALQRIWCVIQEVAASASGAWRTEMLKINAEGIWCFELNSPLSVSLSESEQVERFFSDGTWTGCNDAFASIYGIEDPGEIEGKSIREFVPQEDRHNVGAFLSFVRSGYRQIGVKLHAVSPSGRHLVTHNNIVGHLEEGRLVRVWGTQQDVTDFIAPLGT